MEPGEELRKLQQQILNSDPALAAPAQSARPDQGTGVALGALEVRYSLPSDTAAFTGRDREVGLIAGAGATAAGGPGVIHAIDGMPGLGKTALAVHAAHLLRRRFPDRQLFIDLHAHTPGQEPVRPGDGIGRIAGRRGGGSPQPAREPGGPDRSVAGPDGRPAGPAGPGQRGQQ